MGRPFVLSIKESEEELKKRLQTAREKSQIEKLQMLWWIKSGQITQRQEIGQRLAKDSSTITRWLQKYRRGGLQALLEIKKAPGAVRKLSDEVLRDLQAQLNRSEGFSSYAEIVQWLQEKHGLTVEYAVVYHWVRYRLGAKLKVPRPQSHQQNPLAIEAFKKTSALLWSP